MIIQAALPSHPDVEQKILFAVQKLSASMQWLTLRRQLNNEEMEHFLDDVDAFFESWIEVFGTSGVTNYIYLLGSGHMLYFLKQCGCLYLYSQQGWELLMGKIKSILHLNTQRGCKRSGAGKTKSYIYPVMLFIMRDLLWKTCDAHHFFFGRERRKPG